MSERCCLVIPLAILVSVAPSHAAMPGDAPLLGAGKAIEQIAAALNTPLEAPVAKTNSVKQELQHDVEAFLLARDSLAPEAAASRWLALFDRAVRVPPGEDEPRGRWYSPHGDHNGELIGKVLAALPPPAAWPTLRQQILQRPAADTDHRLPECVLRMVSAHLVGDPAALRQALTELVLWRDDRDCPAKEQIESALPELAAAVNEAEEAWMDLPVFELFKTRLEMLRKYPPTSGQVLLLPDLVTLAGTNEAARLIGEALAIPKVTLTVPAGPATRELARKVALEKLASMQNAPWALCVSLDPAAASLYEALDRKFVPQTPVDTAGIVASLVSKVRSYSSGEEEYHAKSLHAQARCCYAMAQFTQGRTNDAAKALAPLDANSSYLIRDTLHKLLRQVAPATGTEFLFFVLSEKPELNLWADWIAASMEAGETNKVIPLLRESEARLPKDPEKSAELMEALSGAWLACDNVDEGVRLIRQQLSRGGDEKGVFNRWGRSDSRKPELALQLARLGVLLGRKEWVEEGTTNAISSVSGGQGGASYRIASVVSFLIEQHDYARAEALVLDAIGASLKSSGPIPSFREGAAEIPVHLAQLAGIYGACGRHADVVALMEQAPWWGADDLAALAQGGGCDGVDLRVVVGTALHAVGRNEEAIRILKDYLCIEKADDAAYAVLAEVEGMNLLPWLDKVYARDRFEERPLIWKAVILQKAGKLDDAESVIRQALKVDPTDGETKAGDRVRSYGVLADILAAKGKAEDATFFRNVVQSVRTAEEGDALTQAGLITRSLPVYEKAQGLFADAYCIQWRLAERLSARGKMAEAEKHYRIAFERMPEQFGRVASLCFGCEGVFKSGPSQGAAERVLKDLVGRTPVKPQVYYLMGQLRETQERWPEAYEAYAAAARLDPGYLDALEKRYRLGSSMLLQRSEQDALALLLLAMDPLGRHACVTYADVEDAKGLWNVIATNQQFAYTPLKASLPLPAARRELEKKKKGHDSTGVSYGEFYSMVRYRSGQGTVPAPGEAILKNNLMGKLLGLLGGNSGYFFD